MTGHAFHDHSSNLVQFLIYAYSLESFLYPALNDAWRNKDISKAATLGPFAAAIGEVIVGVKMNVKRGLTKPDPSRSTSLYRGGALTNKEIGKFEAMKGKLIHNCGLMSATSDKDLALKASLAMMTLHDINQTSNSCSNCS